MHLHAPGDVSAQSESAAQNHDEADASKHACGRDAASPLNRLVYRDSGDAVLGACCIEAGD